MGPVMLCDDVVKFAPRSASGKSTEKKESTRRVIDGAGLFPAGGLVWWRGDAPNCTALDAPP